jgi:hypothetical protein
MSVMPKREHELLAEQFRRSGIDVDFAIPAWRGPYPRWGGIWNSEFLSVKLWALAWRGAEVEVWTRWSGLPSKRLMCVPRADVHFLRAGRRYDRLQVGPKRVWVPSEYRDDVRSRVDVTGTDEIRPDPHRLIVEATAPVTAQGEDWAGRLLKTVTFTKVALIVLALAFALIGAYGSVLNVYRAASWDTFHGTLSRCDDLDLRTPTCFASFIDGDQSREVQLESGWIGTPRIGERVTIWVSDDRESASVGGWRAIVNAGVPLVIGLAIGGFALFGTALRRSRWLWGPQGSGRPSR